MRFQVPQFIERETRIAGPLTFRQYGTLAIAGAMVVFLYMLLAKKSFLIFLGLSGSVIGTAVAIAFISIGGRSLPTVLGHFFFFSVSPKLYLWRKKNLPPKIIWKKTEEKKAKKEPEEIKLKLVEKSRLRQMAAIIETKH